MTGIETWRTRHGDTVELYRAGDGIRYRVKARNGEIVEQSSEAYASSTAAHDGAARHHPVINDLTEDQADEIGTTGEQRQTAASLAADDAIDLVIVRGEVDQP